MDIETDSADLWLDPQAAEEKAKQKAEKDVQLRMVMDVREVPYRVRLVSSSLRFRKYFHPFNILGKYPISPAYYEKEKDLDVAWNQGNWLPSKKGVVVVIDREHPGMLRLVEAGEQVFGAFEKYASMTKKSPSGPSAPDFLISVTEEKSQKKYSVMADPDGPKPFTDEEKALIGRSKLTKEFLEERMHYKRETPESIKELWLQLPEDKRYWKGKDGEGQGTKPAPKAAPVPEAKPAPQAAKPVPPKVAAKDDNFLKEQKAPEPAAAPAAAAPAAAPAPAAAAPEPDEPEDQDVNGESGDDPEAVSLF